MPSFRRTTPVAALTHLFILGGYALAAGIMCSAQRTSPQRIDLPTSKQLILPVPGAPQRINSLPMSMAVSPDGRYVVTVNAGYGTYDSKYMQSLAVFDTRTGTLVDFPDDRTPLRAKETLYSGLVFGHDGSHLYASIASLSDPQGKESGDVGTGVVVYGVRDGKVKPERLLKIPLQQLAPGHTTLLIGSKPGDKGVPYPAAIAVLGSAGSEKLLVADNLSDDVLLMDAATGAIEKRFDLAESDAVPSTYPIALAVAPDQQRAFVALWNASEVVELDLKTRTIARKLPLLKPESATTAGSHPCALEIAPDGKTMYVALANRDSVAAINIGAGQFSTKGYFDTRLPHQSYFGAEPEALAVSSDGTRVYAADAITDAIAVFDPTRLNGHAAKQGMVEPIGFVPTDWMPMSMAFTGGRLYVAAAKGEGTGPNNFPQRQADWQKARGMRAQPSTYIGTLLYGSLAVLDPRQAEAELPRWTDEVIDANRMKAAEEKIRFAGGANPIRHIIYIIKENRTYDQILGDLEKDGRKVGNGDPSLTMFGTAITPNEHKLALQFGVLDNFFDSGEVSGDGHVWSNAAIGTDYLEKNWQQNYRGSQRPYDFEGVVAEGYPLLQKIPDVNEPQSGYLWGNLSRQGKTYYHFAEYISTKFCDTKETANPQQGPLIEGMHCNPSAIRPGAAVPAEWGGGVNKWPWPIPLIAQNTATKPELVGHFAPESPDFNLRVPDQIRVNVFLRHLEQWQKDRAAGHDTMPEFIQLRLPNDHTAGTVPGGPTPRSSVADNDLAVGRAVEAISHSAYWDDTAFFILEDDAQAGADHVDAHRSIAFVVSKYAPHPRDGEAAVVDSRFYSTVSVIRTMESLLGLPPMNNNDAFASLISTLFTGPGDQPPYDADYSNRDNGLIYAANKSNAIGAAASMKMDFTHADRAPTEKLNLILWQDAKGTQPPPAMLLQKHPKHKDDDDD
jgi:DNA-binding beta-propeller fold protein YncE